MHTLPMEHCWTQFRQRYITVMAQVIEKEIMIEADPYLEKFERFEREAQHPAWLLPLRKAGISSFAEQGFPTLKHEDWRYTNVAPIARLAFKPALETVAEEGAREAIDRMPFKELTGHRLVFVDGHYAAGLSSVRS